MAPPKKKDTFWLLKAASSCPVRNFLSSPRIYGISPQKIQNPDLENRRKAFFHKTNKNENAMSSTTTTTTTPTTTDVPTKWELVGGPIPPEWELTHRYWQASNYLSVGQVSHCHSLARKRIIRIGVERILTMNMILLPYLHSFFPKPTNKHRFT